MHLSDTTRFLNWSSFFGSSYLDFYYFYLLHCHQVVLKLIVKVCLSCVELKSVLFFLSKNHKRLKKVLYSVKQVLLFLFPNNNAFCLALLENF